MGVRPKGKPVVWLKASVKTPPFSFEARIEAGQLLRKLQAGEKPAMPHARAMPSIGAGCCELRINDRDKTWRIVCYIADDAVVVLEVFAKDSQATPQSVIRTCKKRLKDYQNG